MSSFYYARKTDQALETERLPAMRGNGRKVGQTRKSRKKARCQPNSPTGTKKLGIGFPKKGFTASKYYIFVKIIKALPIYTEEQPGEVTAVRIYPQAGNR
jgi:hypothetical protein